MDQEQRVWGSPRSEASGSTLLEREEELPRFDDLIGALHAARGRVLLVEGPAGIGKTSLLHELRDRAERAGVLVLGARVGELDRGMPYAVARQLIEHLPELQAELPLPEPTELKAGSAPPSDHVLLQNLHRRLVELAAERPLLLIVDDVHWADPGSLRFLVHVATRVEWSPVSLAVTLRSGDLVVAPSLLQELVSDSQAEELRPRPLSPTALAQLIEAMLHRPPHPSFTTELHAATGGNPLLVTELLRDLHAENVIPSAEATDSVRGAGPRAVAQSVLRHISRLGDAAVAYAHAVAILGDGSHEAARMLADLDPETADAALDLLAAAQALERAERACFRYPVVRRAVYQHLPPSTRAAAHARAAEVLRELGAPPDAVAEHLLRARARGDPVTADALHQAARRSLDRGAPADAAQYLRRALQEPAPADQRPAITRDLADALLRLGDAAAPHWVEQAHALPGSGATQGLVRRAAALRALRGERAGRAEQILDGSPAREVLEAILAERPAAELGDVAVAALPRLELSDAAALESPAVALCAAGAILADRDAEAAECLDRAADRALAIGSTVACATVFGARARAGLAAGRLAEADADAAIAVEAARSAGLALLLPLLAALRTLVQLEREGPDAAWHTVRHLRLDDVERQTPFATRILEARAAVHLAAGRPREALADLEGVEAAPAPLSRWRGCAAAAYLTVGDTATATALAVRELERARAFGAPREIGAALRVRARTAEARTGEALLREAVAVLERSHDRLELAGALVDLGALLRRENRRIEARPELHRGQALALHCGALRLQARAAAELAATGARSRVADPAAVERLTASERRVAELAAAGRSNPQIASELVVTRKTVELHLTNAYRKLGIRSRADLAEALGRPLQDP